MTTSRILSMKKNGFRRQPGDLALSLSELSLNQQITGSWEMLFRAEVLTGCSCTGDHEGRYEHIGNLWSKIRSLEVLQPLKGKE